MKYTLYILFSIKLNKYYIGHTGDDMAERLRRHLSNHTGFTAKFKDWQVVCEETFASKEDAFKRELQIKGWKSRRRMESLFNG